MDLGLLGMWGLMWHLLPGRLPQKLSQMCGIKGKDMHIFSGHAATWLLPEFAPGRIDNGVHNCNQGKHDNGIDDTSANAI